jgi:hypothetical protein
LGAVWVVTHGGYHFTSDVEQRWEASLERLQRVVGWGMTHTFRVPWRDGRIVLSAFAWLLFAVYLYTRQLLGWRGGRTHWIIIAGFTVFVLMLLVYQFRA